MVISMLKIRRPLGRLIFNMGIAIPGKTVFLIETAPRSRTRQNFELVHINGPLQNFGPPARNLGPLKAEFAWRE